MSSDFGSLLNNGYGGVGGFRLEGGKGSGGVRWWDRLSRNRKQTFRRWWRIDQTDVGEDSRKVRYAGPTGKSLGLNDRRRTTFTEGTESSLFGLSHTSTGQKKTRVEWG